MYYGGGSKRVHCPSPPAAAICAPLPSAHRHSWPSGSPCPQALFRLTPFGPPYFGIAAMHSISTLALALTSAATTTVDRAGGPLSGGKNLP